MIDSQLANFIANNAFLITSYSFVWVHFRLTLSIVIPTYRGDIVGVTRNFDQGGNLPNRNITSIFYSASN